MSLLVESFHVIGRIVKDAETIQSKDGLRKAIVFPIAVNYSVRNGAGEYVKEVNFYDVSKWHNADVNIDKQLSFLKKGVLIAVVGVPKARAYMNKENRMDAKINIVINEYSILNYVRIENGNETGAEDVEVENAFVEKVDVVEDYFIEG